MNKRKLPSGELLSLLLLAVCIQCTNAATGLDYPCSKTGFFIDPDSCQDYYECRLFRGSLFPVPARCPHGRIYDDAFSECRPKKLVTSPPRCVQESAVTEEGHRTVEAVVVDSPVVGVIVDSSAVGVTDNSSGVEIVDNSSVVAVVDDSAVVGVVDDSSVVGVANDSSVIGVVDDSSVQVGDMTRVIDQDSPAPAEGNVNGNGTGTLEDIDAVGQDVNGTSDPLVNGTMIVNSTEEIVVVSNLTLCDHINMVDSYATLVISNPSLKKSFGFQEQYNKNLEKYNQDLEKAQNNTALWRHGDSISAGIKKTIQMTREYKPEFGRKLGINQERIKDISKKEVDPKLVDRLTADIKRLQEEIESAEQALSYTDVPDIRKYFDGLIASKQRTIERKQQEMKSTSKVARLLKELVNFLEYVRDDTQEVEDVVKHCQGQMDSLNRDMENDARAFKKYANRTDEGILLLIAERETKQRELTEKAAEQETLENRKEKLDLKLDALNDANYDITREIFRLTELMGNKTDNFNKKREAICMPGGILMKQYINENSTRFEKSKACHRLLEERNITLDLSEERIEVRRLRKESKANTRKINQTLENLDSITEDLKQLDGALPHHETRIRQITIELGSLRMHNTDLSNLQEGADTSLRSLLALSEEFQMLGNTFESLTSEFESMMVQANAAEGEAEQLRERIAIEDRLSDIQRQIEQIEVPDIETCTLGH